MGRGGRFGMAVAGAAFAAVVMGACSNSLDVAKGEAEIKKDLQDPSIGLTVESVTCPKDVPVKANTTFVCKVTIKGGDNVDVKVTQKDDQGNVTLDYKNSLFVPDLANIRSALSNATDVSCPTAVSLNEGKGALLCTATGPDGTSVKINVPIVDGKLVPDEAATSPA